VLFDGDRVVKTYDVAVGKVSTPTPEGEFQIINHIQNPTYYGSGVVIGLETATRWMGLSAKGYGIHGTNVPASNWQGRSHGCIRMRQPDLEELFDLVKVARQLNCAARSSNCRHKFWRHDLQTKTGPEEGETLMTLLRYLLIFTASAASRRDDHPRLGSVPEIFKWRKKRAGGTSTRHTLVHFSSAGYAVRTSLAGGLEHRSGTQRMGRGAGEPILGNAAGNVVFRSASDLSAGSRKWNYTQRATACSLRRRSTIPRKSNRVCRCKRAKACRLDWRYRCATA